MKSSQEIFNAIRDNLIIIKKSGGYIDQYDSALFNLFIEAYRNHYMDFHSIPRLTGQASVDDLFKDEEYSNIPTKTSYNLEERFSEKWSLWNEAFNKGFSSGFIIWRPDN